MYKHYMLCCTLRWEGALGFTLLEQVGGGLAPTEERTREHQNFKTLT